MPSFDFETLGMKAGCSGGNVLLASYFLKINMELKLDYKISVGDTKFLLIKVGMRIFSIGSNWIYS